jgi:GTP pyrophosphokinase
VDDSALQPAAKALKLKDPNQVVAAIGQGEVHVMQVIKILYPGVESTPDPADKPGTLERIVDRVRGTGKGVKIQGADGLLVRYAQCCQPVPGDNVVGYVTRGRGVSIHRGDCPNLLLLVHEPERRLDIDWHEMAGERFVVRLAMDGTDRRGLYADVAAAVSATGTDIKSLELKSTDGRVTGAALVEVENLAHLERIIKADLGGQPSRAVDVRRRLTPATAVD